MDIKMVLCDLDGTLFTSDKTISPYTRSVIEKLRNNGVLFGIATGRGCEQIASVFQKQGWDHLIDVVVGFGGGEVIDYPLGIHEKTYQLSPKTLRAIVDHFQDFDITFGIPEGTYMMVSDDSDIIRHVRDINKIPLQVVDFDHYILKPAEKICVFCWEEDLDALEEHAKTFPQKDYRCYYVRSGPYLVEYADERVTKDRGIDMLLGYHGFTKEQLMVFGDADNDYQMINYATYGIVMANGSPLTKSVAYDIALDNDHDGVAHYIEDHLL